MDFFGVHVSLTYPCLKIFLILFSLSPARLVPLAYTIKKLQITCVVEDDKVTDLLLLSPLISKFSLSVARSVPIFSRNVLWNSKISFNRLILHPFKRFKNLLFLLVLLVTSSVDRFLFCNISLVLFTGKSV